MQNPVIAEGSIRRRTARRLLGLGLVLCAIFTRPLQAQEGAGLAGGDTLAGILLFGEQGIGERAGEESVAGERMETLPEAEPAAPGRTQAEDAGPRIAFSWRHVDGRHLLACVGEAADRRLLEKVYYTVHVTGRAVEETTLAWDNRVAPDFTAALGSLPRGTHRLEVCLFFRDHSWCDRTLPLEID